MPRLQTSSCFHTIRPITLRLKTYPEYPNPTRTDPDGIGDDATGYVYSHMTGHGDTTITIRPSIGIRIWRDARITIYDYRNSGVAGCGYMTASIYLISFFYYRYFKCLKSLFDRLPSGMIAWIRMYRIFYLPDSIMVPAIRFFSAAVAFFLVASWSVTGWEKPSPSQPWIIV